MAIAIEDLEMQQQQPQDEADEKDRGFAKVMNCLLFGLGPFKGIHFTPEAITVYTKLASAGGLKYAIANSARELEDIFHMSKTKIHKAIQELKKHKAIKTFLAKAGPTKQLILHIILVDHWKENNKVWKKRDKSKGEKSVIAELGFRLGPRPDPEMLEGVLENSPEGAATQDTPVLPSGHPQGDQAQGCPTSKTDQARNIRLLNTKRETTRVEAPAAPPVSSFSPQEFIFETSEKTKRLAAQVASILKNLPLADIDPLLFLLEENKENDEKVMLLAALECRAYVTKIDGHMCFAQYQNALRYQLKQALKDAQAQQQGNIAGQQHAPEKKVAVYGANEHQEPTKEEAEARNQIHFANRPENSAKHIESSWELFARDPQSYAMYLEALPEEQRLAIPEKYHHLIPQQEGM